MVSWAPGLALGAIGDLCALLWPARRRLALVSLGLKSISLALHFLPELPTVSPMDYVVLLALYGTFVVSIGIDGTLVMACIRSRQIAKVLTAASLSILFVLVTAVTTAVIFANGALP
jgi:hypothetical protein